MVGVGRRYDHRMIRIARPFSSGCAAVALFSAACGVTTGKPIERGPPPRVVLGDTVSSSGLRNTPPNAVPFSQTCPPGGVVVGYTGTENGTEVTNQLQSLQGFCATLSVHGTSTLAVSTMGSESMPMVGDAAGSVAQTQMCPNGEMVVAFTGRSGSDIDQIAIVCAAIVIDGTYPNYRLSLGEPDQRPPIGNGGGAPFDIIACPTGQVAIGDEGRAATIVNTFGLLCATPVLVL
jgi:hypothetical protein